MGNEGLLNRYIPPGGFAEIGEMMKLLVPISTTLDHKEVAE